MILDYQIEYQPQPGEFDYIDVDFEASVTKQNDSFGTPIGYCRRPAYNVVENITWDKSKFSESDNRRIMGYLDQNFDQVAQDFLA